MHCSDLILIGAGGHARACIDVIEQHGGFRIAGLVGQAHDLQTRYLSYSVIATDDDLPELARQYKCAIVTVGQIVSPDIRVRLYEQAMRAGFQLPNLISPSAQVSKHAHVGAGTIVMHGAIVNSGAQVGNNCIINTRALIEHDAVIGDHCHISTGAIVNGAANVGTGSFIGSASVIKEGVRVGSRCIVGMAATVLRNVDNGSKYLSRCNA